jgi:lipopolysaccharide export system ATP-binding protein
VNRPQGIPPELDAFLAEHAKGDRSTVLALYALISAASDSGEAVFNDVAVHYRADYLELLREEGRDAEREAGRLSLDEVRDHLGGEVLPRLAQEGLVVLPEGGITAPDNVIRMAERHWAALRAVRRQIEAGGVAEVVRRGEEITGPHRAEPATGPRGSTLEAQGLVKSYRKRRVVNDVGVRLRQGEIVGLLGPNGAGKTTTFYMIVGLIPPQEGRILLDGVDITEMPMFRRARQGIGYLSQEPSVFRKLTVEENLLAILETLDLTEEQRQARLERLLDELSIKRLRGNRAYSLSGGERRRLEITRALVTEPKFMMLDEPFAGVDPIAVHDIQSIVAGLRHRGIGVLISDHNVEQTLDIVDRAYIMFDGQVKVSGTVQELVFDDTVAEIYLGPTLTARLRGRFAERSGDAFARPSGVGA